MEASQPERRTSSNAPTRALLTEFDRLHRDTLGVPAVIQGGKDARLIAGLWRSHGDELTRALMADFFATDDEFIQNAGYSVGVFVSQAAKLIAKRQRARLPAVRDPRRRPSVTEDNLSGLLHDLEVGYDERRSAPTRRLDEASRRRS